MKKLFVIAISCLLLLSITACGKSAVTLDAAQLAADLHDQLTFTDRLYELDADTAKTLFSLDDDTTCVAYGGTGATAEELAVFTAKDESAAKTLAEQLQLRLDERIEGYKNYLPEEVYKLERAVLEQNGKYVIFCVAEDVSAAADVIAQAAK